MWRIKESLSCPIDHFPMSRRDVTQSVTLTLAWGPKYVAQRNILIGNPMTLTSDFFSLEQLWNVKPKGLHFNIAPPFWVKPPPEERKQSFKTQKLNEPIRGGQEVPHPLTLTHQSVANKTSLVKELTNPLKLPLSPLYSIKIDRRRHSGLCSHGH